MNRFCKQTLQGAALSMLGLLIPAAGQAFFINATTEIGSEFQVEFLLKDLDADGNNNVNNFGQYTDQEGQDISATVLFTLTSFGDTEIGFEMHVRNTTEQIGNEIGLQAFAFGTNPDATSITLTQISTGDGGGANKFTSASLTIAEQLNNAVALLDVQTSTGVGYPRTLQEQEWDRFLLTVGFASTTEGVTFSPFGTMWQGEPDSFQFGANGGGIVNGGGVVNGGGTVPEPATLALFGGGLLGLGWMMRRRNRVDHIG